MKTNPFHQFCAFFIIIRFSYSYIMSSLVSTRYQNSEMNKQEQKLLIEKSHFKGELILSSKDS